MLRTPSLPPSLPPCRWDDVADSIPLELLQRQGSFKGLRMAVQFYQRRVTATQVWEWRRSIGGCCKSIGGSWTGFCVEIIYLQFSSSGAHWTPRAWVPVQVN